MTLLAELLEKAMHAHRGGELEAALAGYESILQQEAGNADALHLSGLIFHQQGRHRQAITRISAALAVNSSVAAVHNSLGEARRACGEWQLALQSYEQALALNPDYAPAKYNCGLVYSAIGDNDKAQQTFDAVTRIDPAYAPAWKSLAKSSQLLRQSSIAVSAWKEYLSLNPDDVAAWVESGVATLAMGRIDDATVAARNAIKIESENGAAWQLLANCKRYREVTDADIVMAQQILASPSLSTTAHQSLSYALGKMLDDCGQYDSAFAHYTAANAGSVEAAEAAAVEMAALVAHLKKLFTASFMAARTHWGSATEQPVFIVGMPRSGTTLVEQILSMHPQVSARGELKALGEAIDTRATSINMLANFPMVVTDFGADDVLAMADSYLQQIAPEPGIKRVTDKMPFNSRFIGMIRLLFPNAHILHCQRDPRDTCLSNYFQAFSGNDQSTDLLQLGRYYRAQEQMMQDWKSLFPDHIHTIEYEQLVADPEPIVRKILLYLQLPWDEHCLSFHRSQKGVQTASAQQVREPIYQRSVNRWREYQAYIEPLIRGLGGG